MLCLKYAILRSLHNKEQSFIDIKTIYLQQMCFVVCAVNLHVASNCITFFLLITTSSVTECSLYMLLFTKQIIVVPFNFTT